MSIHLLKFYSFENDCETWDHYIPELLSPHNLQCVLSPALHFSLTTINSKSLPHSAGSHMHQQYLNLTTPAVQLLLICKKKNYKKNPVCVLYYRPNLNFLCNNKNGEGTQHCPNPQFLYQSDRKKTTQDQCQIKSKFKQTWDPVLLSVYVISCITIITFTTFEGEDH